MARGDQLGRQWKIIQRLLSSRRGRSVSEIAEEIDCHPRTVYRDLEALQLAGFPIYTDRVGGTNLWSLLDTVRQQIPLPLSLTELMALYFSRDLLKTFGDTAFHEPLESLFGKIRATLPPSYIESLDRIGRSLRVGPGPRRPRRGKENLIDPIRSAIDGKRAIEIDYYTMSRKSESRRRIHPYTIWFFDGTFYLIGFCTKRKEVRIFSLDRIRRLEPTDTPFQVPESFDIDRFMEASFGVFRGTPVQVRIRFSPAIAGYIRETVWHTSQVLTDQEDGSVLFEATVAGTEEIRRWILGWGRMAIVLEPESLRRELAEEAKAIIEAHG